MFFVLFTVTDDVLNADLDVIVPAGARVCEATLADLHESEYIDRVQLNGAWCRLLTDAELGFTVEVEATTD